MKNLKIAVLAFGVLGLISMFIPMEGMTLFSLFKLVGTGQLIIMLAAFGIPTVIGAMAMKTGLKKPQAIAATAAFGLACWKMEIWKIADSLKGPLPVKLIVIAALGGIVVSILGIVKSEE